MLFSYYRDRIFLSDYPHDDSPMSMKEREDLADRMIDYLLAERGEIAAFNVPYAQKRDIIRGYLNERDPIFFDSELLKEWDHLLWCETKEKGIVDVNSFEYGNGITMWQGDITRLNADAIVNAANRSLLGCFIPHHYCIDNVIHSGAGPQMRADCAKIMAIQGRREKEGNAKVTCAYNLPSRYVLHTVGPLMSGAVTDENRAVLRSSYISCLDLANELGLKTIAFCCVATGVFGFPNDEAAEIATGTVINWLHRNRSDMRVIFDVFTDRDKAIYENILKYI
ncbi:MAG: protein-ADP-ribose hydrolase [Clostridia bacterium]|nr:protein-ADP-ribose hydrolase [Clostridia bacterium]